MIESDQFAASTSCFANSHRIVQISGERPQTVDARAQITSAVLIDWQLSSYFGWGIYGINLMLNWARRNSGLLLTGLPIDESIVDLDPIEWAIIRPAVEASRRFHVALEPVAGNAVSIDRPIIHGLGNDFAVAGSSVHGVRLSGKPNVGVTFFERTDFSADGRERAKAFPLIVAGSTWNQQMLEGSGIGPSTVALQGIDPTMFHPAPRGGWFGERFAVFTGGKLEYRKGQDLVIKAFRVFADRHPDALLIAAWSSPWPGVAHSLDSDASLTPVPFLPDGRVDVTAWVTANGIRSDQFIDLGALPNRSMPRLYREMDVALFPNRCEGGTNLVAMECMGCGVPVILSNNTGHLDLIGDERCFRLEEQARIPGADCVGWGESSIEEIVETLEAVYRDRAQRLQRGARAAEFMRTMTWLDTVEQLTGAIAPYV